MAADLTKAERIEMLYEAQESLRVAHDLIQNAVRGTSHYGYVEAYILDHLKIMIASGHGFLTRDTNLDDVMRMLEGGEKDEVEALEEA